jgi:ataxia telangiectasia mutated family protein
LDRYFEPAIRALDREVDNKERSQVHIAFARFADGQHEELRDMAKERNIRFAAYEKRKNLELKEMERRLQDGSLESGDIKRTRKQAEDHLEDDRRQLIEAQQLAKDMLWRALHNYALALTTSDAHDDHVFRFCALWLSCADDDDLHGKLKKPLADVPSHKFVFLAYQLSARLTKSPKPTAAASNIQTLVYRLCTQHPFHSLYPVQSLRSTEGGSAPSSRSSRRSSTMSRESSVGLGSNNSRAQAADDLLEKAKRSDRLRPRIEAVELVCCAYAEWASFNLKSHSAYLVDSSADSRQLKKSAADRSHSQDQGARAESADPGYDLPPSCRSHRALRRVDLPEHRQVRRLLRDGRWHPPAQNCRLSRQRRCRIQTAGEWSVCRQDYGPLPI